MGEKKIPEEKIIKAFHMMWDNYPEQVRLIDRSFRVVAGNPDYFVHFNNGLNEIIAKLSEKRRTKNEQSK